MARVNRKPASGAEPEPPEHLAYLLHRVVRRMRAEGERHSGGTAPLRASESRLLDLLPPDGARLTELSGQLGISKQGLGQLAAQLAAQGYVEIGADPGDRRARLVRRTPSGDAYRATARAALVAVEEQWRAAVGARRYATFRAVLRELATADDAAD